MLSARPRRALLHRAAAPKLIACFEQMPERMACESFEISDLDLPSGGYAEWYESECWTKRYGRTYEVRVRSIVFPHEGLDHDRCQPRRSLTTACQGADRSRMGVPDHGQEGWRGALIG